MPNHNIIQHLLVHLLNPGMFNEPLLKAAIEEFKKEDINSLMEHRFNFQNLKPALLPIQEELLDKTFYTFFKDFSKNHALELSNGSIYKINLYSLCRIVKEFNNPTAKKVAEEIIKAIVSSPKVNLKKIEEINFTNSRCKFELRINEKQFLTADYTKSVLSEVDQFCITLLTQKNGELINFYDYLSTAKKQDKFLTLLEQNQKDKWKILNALLIGTKTEMAQLASYPKIASYLVDDKIFVEAIMEFLNKELGGKNSYQIISAPFVNFIKAVNKKADYDASVLLLKNIMTLPEHLMYNYNMMPGREAIALDIDSSVEYMQSKCLKNAKFSSKELAFLAGNIKIELSKKTIEEKMVKYLETVALVCQKGSTSQSSTMSSFIAPIIKALDKGVLSIDTLKTKSKELYQILAHHANTTPLSETLLSKGWHFPNKLETLTKSYALSCIKLTKPQVIINEKNLISNAINKVEAKAKSPKFKV